MQGLLSGVAEVPTEIGAKEIFVFTACDICVYGEEVKLVEQALIDVAPEGVLCNGVIPLAQQQRKGVTARASASHTDAGRGGGHEGWEGVRVLRVLEAWFVTAFKQGWIG